MRRRSSLQRLFSAFPGGWPGLGLLLLRTAIGTVALFQGGFYIAGAPSPGAWIAGLLALFTGASILIGFLTPLAGVVLCLCGAAATLSLLPAPSPSLFQGPIAAVFAVTMTAAIVFLGPGAYSLDARLFGRREIIIPPIEPRPR